MSRDTCQDLNNSYEQNTIITNKRMICNGSVLNAFANKSVNIYLNIMSFRYFIMYAERKTIRIVVRG